MYQVSVAGKAKAIGNRVLRRGAALHGNQRGAALIEFALIAAPFLALLIGTFETTITLFTQQVLETANEKAARTILTGTAQSSSTTQAQFKTQICNSMPSFMQCANVLVDVQTASSISAANTGSPTLTYDVNGNLTNTWSYNVGNPGDIVVVRAMYLLKTVTGPLNFSLANTQGGNRLLVSTYVFRNEG